MMSGVDERGVQQVLSPPPHRPCQPYSITSFYWGATAGATDIWHRVLLTDRPLQQAAHMDGKFRVWSRHDT